MKLFITISTLLAVASASHLYLAPARLLAPASSQYHSQDGIGQYAYGYNDHLSTKQEVKSFDGTTRGSYSYIDSNNALQSVDYIADAGGFRVAATNLPKAVEAPVQEQPKQVSDTFEVAAAKSAHLAAVEQAKLQVSAPLDIAAPQQVMDTPEVSAAKAEHFAAVNAAKLKLGYQAIAIPAQTELPQQVAETPEVMKAKAEHFAAIAAAKARYTGYSAIVELPRPVEDTPEVAKAKAEHLLAIEQAKIGNSHSKISLTQRAPLIVGQYGYSAYSLPSTGFAYSTSGWDSSKVLKAPIVAPNELPQQVTETPEVVKAKKEHFAAIDAAKARYTRYSAAIELPRPVEDTPEVAKAKAEHLLAIEQAKIGNSHSGISLTQRAPLIVGQYGYSAYSLPSTGFAYSTGVWDGSKVLQAPIVAPIELPQQVTETPEVVKAKKEHFAAVDAAKARNTGFSAAIELPRPVEDTPEVAKAKAEHLLAIEQAKIGNSNSGISLTQRAPLIVGQYGYSAYSLPSTGFGYSTSILHGSEVQKAPIVAQAVPVSLPSHGFSYSTSVVDAPVSHVRYAPYYRVDGQGW